ncbi:hypothetical protein AXF42_Ash019764 [Apostasia shenzhenica]|uniref:CCHC-type domain-containing protein n=1 Tax=Apostasia shenzhenica TaxID=1088818 RepID=A0A2H9ZRT4_9ASPA|nr:hypothetical protein AXF42_Ash019764 [Apostasia shenzhenica]
MQSKLASSLVGKVFGRRLPFHFLAAELHKRWGHYDGFKVLDAGKDCFICQFKNDADRDAIIRSGPWTVAGQILGLDVWSLDFNPSSSVGASTPIWVRLPELPLYCWGKENLARISSDIGVPLWLDPVTANMEKIAFARVCVRVNLAQPLKLGVWINGPKGKFFQRVEYEGITVICFKCGVVGHRDKNCPLLGPTSQANVTTIPSPVPSNDMMEINAGNATPSGIEGNLLHTQPDPCENASKESVGPWMLVTNCRKPIKLAGQQPKQAAGNHLTKSKPATSLNSARQQQQQQIATHHQQKSSAQQYRVVGQQGIGAKTPQNSHLNIPKRLNKQTSTGETQDCAIALQGLLQKNQTSTVDMQDSAVAMQGLMQQKQKGTVDIQNSAIAMQGLLQKK